jgi:hypothetical protein
MTTMTTETLISQARFQTRTPELADVPAWADLPAPLARAVKDRDRALDQWAEVESDLAVALAKLEGADVTDATNIRDAARAGTPMPDPLDRTDLARAVEYEIHRTNTARTVLSGADAKVKAALAAHGRALVPQAIDRARKAVADYAALVAEAQATLTRAVDVYRDAPEALRDIRDLVRDNMQFSLPDVLPEHRVKPDGNATRQIHELTAMLERRGWGKA